jgi:glycosyltransferase involved in cell wall biosynthesis
LTAKRFTEWSGLEEAKFYYLPNCIDEAQYGVAPKRQDLCEKFGLENKKVIMTAGRMDLIEYPLHRKPINQRKGFDEVLEVLPELRAREPNVAYLIIGDGDDKSRLQKKAKDLSVDDIVVFAGYVPDEDKADYYRLADAFVMPGSNPLFDRYPFRFVFLEALACGVPVVGCQLLDESEVDDSDAKQLIIQVDPSDPEDLQRGILEALSIPKSLYPEIKDYYYSTFETKVHKIIDEVMSCHASNNVFRNT